MERFLETNIAILKALSDETRLKIVYLLSEHRMCGNELLEHFHITQPTLSYHMKILQDANVVVHERRASSLIFDLNPDVFSTLQNLIRRLQEDKRDLHCV